MCGGVPGAVGADLSYSRNSVTLPGGSFTTDLVGARILYGFSPRAFLNAFIQYNAAVRAGISTSPVAGYDVRSHVESADRWPADLTTRIGGVEAVQPGGSQTTLGGDPQVMQFGGKYDSE